MKQGRGLDAVLFFRRIVGEALDDRDEVGLQVLVMDDVRYMVSKTNEENTSKWESIVFGRQ